MGKFEDIDELLLAQLASDGVAVSLEDYIEGLQCHIYVQGTKIVLKLRRDDLIIF